ncbi:DNA/RNA non-specific endonuclease [Micromonospora sp. WMMD736]|uniref:DNA/RNA non-specific endonuclease n=1 Tax=Micromonospora sp. WMMD736 TaxID=3404112 RepID=UPI003B944DEA
MDALTRLKAMNTAMRRRDYRLNSELREREEGEGPMAELPGGELQLETIVMRTGRPVLAVKHDEAQLTFDDADSEVWRMRLTEARPLLARAAKAVGRIEVEGHSLEWLGTGWLIAPEIIVTNRHVAAEFGRRNGAGLIFRQGLNGQPMRASIDLLEELDRDDSLTFELRQILHIEDSDGPDLAFLRVDQSGGEAPATPIALAETSEPDDFVAVIGYPARDSRIPDADLMDRIFGDVYNKKRLAPGQVLDPIGGTLRHDCSTLGGNSGSVVLSLGTGDAVGLHFAGRFLEANFAVSSRVVAQRLEDLRSGRTNLSRSSEDRPDVQTARPPAVPTPLANRSSTTTLTQLVPVSITVQIGDPYPAPVNGSRVPAPATDVGVVDDSGEDGEVFVEAVAEDYIDRQGYQASFLGDDLDVPLPIITGDPDDVLTFEFNSVDEQVLRYQHFSTLMSASRRLCRFSAVNIDGNRPKRFARVGWRTDPRIPETAQIKSQCYGNPPRFSRGHMTRREDPIWGSDNAASRGNTDSMHVTNAVPQMQPFNAGVWLDLEDYALQNARRDDMKISVFTGPFLDDADPTMFGVQIPVEFWKVIAFIHDETNELSATGYTMSQRDFLREEEFIFGAHETAQRSIRSIELRAGISFGRLAELDPFVEPEGIAPLLTDVRQIQFIRRR